MILFRSNPSSILPPLSDRRLKPQTAGFLCLMFFCADTPDLENLSPWDICKIRNIQLVDSKQSILDALSELEKAGYLLFFQWRWESDYVFFETPRLKDEYLQKLSGEEKQQLSTKLSQGARYEQNS